MLTHLSARIPVASPDRERRGTPATRRRPAARRPRRRRRCSCTCRTRTAGSCTPTAPPASSSASRPRRSSAGCPRSSSIRPRWSGGTSRTARCCETGRPIDVEDGWGGRTHLTHKTPVFDSDGEPVGVIGISTDITDRKRAEDELRRSERRLSEAQQIAGVGSWHWDVRDRRADAGRPSSAACSAWRRRRRRRARSALLLVHEDDRERVVEASRAALAGEAPLDLDVRIMRGDGEIRILHCRGERDDGPRRVAAAGSTAPASTSPTGAAPSGAWPRRSGSRSSAPSTGTSPATRSRGRARCTGSSARTRSTSSRPAAMFAERIVRGGPRGDRRAGRRARASTAATSTRSRASGSPTGSSARCTSAARW